MRLIKKASNVAPEQEKGGSIELLPCQRTKMMDCYSSYTPPRQTTTTVPSSLFSCFTSCSFSSHFLLPHFFKQAFHILITEITESHNRRRNVRPIAILLCTMSRIFQFLFNCDYIIPGENKRTRKSQICRQIFSCTSHVIVKM